MSSRPKSRRRKTPRPRRRPRSSRSDSAKERPRRPSEPKTLGEARILIESLREQLDVALNINRRMSALQDRWERERGELLTRIQRWEAPSEEVVRAAAEAGPKGPPTQTEDDRGTSPSYTEEDLARMGLVENSEGGVIHEKTGVLYESVADFVETQEYLKKHGHGPDVNPRTLKRGRT